MAVVSLVENIIESRSNLLCQRLSAGIWFVVYYLHSHGNGEQVWFQNLAFRTGVYQCQSSPEATTKFEDSPIFQLQVTFAALQYGNKTVFNPVKLVESLQLRTSEQQDAQELVGFDKLLFSLWPKLGFRSCSCLTWILSSRNNRTQNWNPSYQHR